jgi:hypothetical protein
MGVRIRVRIEGEQIRYGWTPDDGVTVWSIEPEVGRELLAAVRAPMQLTRADRHNLRQCLAASHTRVELPIPSFCPYSGPCATCLDGVASAFCRSCGRRNRPLFPTVDAHLVQTDFVQADPVLAQAADDVLITDIPPFKYVPSASRLQMTVRPRKPRKSNLWWLTTMLVCKVWIAVFAVGFEPMGFLIGLLLSIGIIIYLPILIDFVQIMVSSEIKATSELRRQSIERLNREAERGRHQ